MAREKKSTSSGSRIPVIENPEAQNGQCSTIHHELLEKVRADWQPFADHELSHEDAREIVENLVDFFVLLDKWDRCDRCDE